MIVGAGAAGIAMGMQLKRAGYTRFTIVERSRGVAGTWHDNRYPGAGCDVPSHLYCFSFAPNPGWDRKFALQPEIERYFQRCVDEAGLGPHLRLGREVRAATWDGDAWRIELDDGTQLVANVLISGTGQLNRPYVPALPGADTFAGRAMHSARWDASLDLAGKRVVVIGNGASAVQIIPQIAQVAGHVTVMQRSPSYVIRRNDRRYREWEKWLFRTVPGARRLYRDYIYWSLEARFSALRPGSLMSKLIRRMALGYLHDVVADPVLRAKLTPDYPLGCKRILISDDWYEALVRPNVEVVTSAIDRFVPEGLVTVDGVTHRADVAVYATGFEATSFLVPMQITGRDGIALHDAWRAGAEAHRGITISGFPNLFLLYGPNTNLGHNSILFMIECQVSYVIRCLEELERRGARSLDVRAEAMARSNAEVQRALADTAWAADCHSWYKTADGKITNNWSSRVTRYWWQTRRPDFDEYEIR